METIDQYSKEWIHIYTEGSAFKATVNAGYGAIIHYPLGEKEEIFNPCGSFCSNFFAEKQAISEVLKHVSYSFDKAPNKVKDLVNFTVSLPALQELESGEMRCKDISQIVIACDNLYKKYGIQSLPNGSQDIRESRAMRRQMYLPSMEQANLNLKYP